MKVVDIDLLFEKFIRNYMKENAGKFTEEEWEDKVPELYSQFGGSPIEQLGGVSPADYYGKLSAEELCKLLKTHIDEDVPVSDFLCEAIVKADTESGLLQFLKKGTDEELISYAVNILNDKACKRALPIYLDYVTDRATDENLRELMGEVLIENARSIPELLLSAAKTCTCGGEYLAEALAGCERSDGIYNYLIEEFAKNKDKAKYAHLLVKYGDDRAVSVLQDEIVKPYIKYADYNELRYAIEALGGECTAERDFSSDSTYRKIKNHKN